MNATMSECGKYRYVLRRSLNSVLRWHRPILFIMLNPSTADANIDDPTIRRCIGFAKRESATHLTVINLFALKATNPKELRSSLDPVGPENDKYIKEEIEKHKTIIAAWGSDLFAKDRAEEVIKKYGPFTCLGVTKHGHPKHPLYLKSDSLLIEYG